MKNKTRGLGGVPSLVELLGNPTREIHRSACGALRNISFGKANEENKVAIKNAGGIPGLVRLLRSSEDPETHELVTGTLWNLSSAEPLKKVIVDDGLTVLTNNVIIPESGWSPDRTMDDLHGNGGVPWSMTFRNATGCLRNTSSAGFETRGKMRECHGLVDTLVYVLKCAVKSSSDTNDMDNKAVENVLCILRNLSFRIANEANHPDAITKPSRSPARDSPSKKKGAPQAESSGCFGNQKKKKAMAANTGNTGTMNKSTMDTNGPLPERTEPARGSELLWQPEMVKPYLSLLSECSNPITLEAAAGTLQNISAGDWIWGGFVRSQVRKDKGLPVLVELLRMENDRVVAAVARALRNLSVDPRNKELIGKYAMRDLVLRLPGGPPRDNEQKQLSNDSLTAILNALHEVILRNAENSKSLRDSSGIDRLVSITQNRANYPPVVVKAAFQVLSTMWSFKDLRVLYKKDGYDEQHFSPGFWSVGKGGSSSATGSPARFNTLPTSGTPKESQQQRSGSVPVDGPSSQPYQSSTLPARDKPNSYSPGPPRSGEAPPLYDSHSYDRRTAPQRDLGYNRDYQRADEPYSEALDPNSYREERDSLSGYSEGTQQSREDIPMREMPYASVDRREPPSDTPDRPVRRGPPVGGVPMFGQQLPQPQVAKGGAVYAQVNKDRKSQHGRARR
ncbi:catenin delta-2-like isoform X2 [Amphiura filiformis]|uniref:catenin delta-2-like isoform X2 n=1 Tax=Amphiura filiformis TaxID=82378 RepID=UPI003B21D974